MRLLAIALAALLIAPALDAQAVRLGAAPSDAVAARLAALDPDAQLRVVSVAADGTPRRLAGPLALAGADLPARAADFVARYAPLFGADAGTTFGPPEPRAPRADGSPRGQHLPQVVHGWPVDGAGLTLALDEDGRATGAHGWLSAAAQGVPAPIVTSEQAVAAVLAHLGLELADLTGMPTARGAIRTVAPTAAVQRVELVRRAGLQPLVVDVDAASGAVLSVRSTRTEGTGNIVLDGQLIKFQTGSGSGNAYASAKKAKSGNESGVSLPDLTLEGIDAELLLLPGTLTGRYAAVSDIVTVLFNEFFSFPFGDEDLTIVDPFGPLIVEAEAFDHVNGYLWLTKTAKFLTKTTGTLPSDTCVPVIVNYDLNDELQQVGLASAYFAPSVIDDALPFAPGFLVFGDFDVATGDYMDDLSRDPTIVSHEYAHCMTFFAGYDFGDTAINPGNTPARAVNEAIADYASTSFHKTPALGAAFIAHSALDFDPPFPGEALRDLSSELTLPDNLFDLVTQFDPKAGDPFLPEEHEAGEIFGCALWRARTGLKAKAANDLIVNDLGNWPQSSAAVGFPDVDEANAAAAYAAYYLECFVSLLNAALEPGNAKAWKQAGKVLGAFLAHGITGTGVDDTVVLPVAGAAKAKLDFKSAFLGTLEQHRLALDLAAGQVLSVTVTGDKADGTLPDFDFDDDEGDFDLPQPKVVNPAGTKVSQKEITVVVPGVYLLTLSTLSGPGGYRAVIAVK